MLAAASVSRSSKIASKTLGSGGWAPSALPLLLSSSGGGMDGGGASVMPFVIHEGNVVPRPRPAGPRAVGGGAASGSSFAGEAALASAGCALASDGAGACASEAVFHEGSVAARPRPAGPATGDDDFSLASFSWAAAPSSLPFSSFCPGGFQLTSIEFAPVRSLRKPPSSPSSRSLCRRPPLLNLPRGPLSALSKLSAAPALRSRLRPWRSSLKHALPSPNSM
mmetsp:Transcript_38706/g.89695  ORF Transcript_38706/g.89695 Transcript_38706/m.89695 type:complete len:223 (-) Transcript_38706:848-1516(-)